MKYLIVDTWNGEGYSQSGVITRAKDKEQAIKIIMNEFKDRYLNYSTKFEVEWLNELTLCFNGESYQGAVHGIELEIDDTFLIIEPSINSVEKTKVSYNVVKMRLTESGCTEESIDELTEELLQVGHGMIDTNDGEYIIYKI